MCDLWKAESNHVELEPSFHQESRHPVQAIRLAGQVVYPLSYITSPKYDSLCPLEFLPNSPFISFPDHSEEFIYNLPPFQQMEQLFLLITLLKFQLTYCSVTACWLRGTVLSVQVFLPKSLLLAHGKFKICRHRNMALLRTHYFQKTDCCNKATKNSPILVTAAWLWHTKGLECVSYRSSTMLKDFNLKHTQSWILGMTLPESVWVGFKEHNGQKNPGVWYHDLNKQTSKW